MLTIFQIVAEAIQLYVNVCGEPAKFPQITLQKVQTMQLSVTVANEYSGGFSRLPMSMPKIE